MADARAIVTRYYEELWNGWNIALADDLLAPDILFRGSIGAVVRGRDQFREYVARIRAAFPDFHNEVAGVVAEGDTLAARLTYSGTHRGALFGIRPSGARIRYGGLAWFIVRNERIAEGYVLGELEQLKQQLIDASHAALTRAHNSRIEPASEHEIPWAADLMFKSEPWITLRRDHESCVRSLRSPSALLFVAHDTAGAPAGFVLIEPQGVAGAPYIKSIGVAPDRRGLGIGSDLLRFAEDMFRGDERHLFLCVSSFNPRAKALYERVGYAVVGKLEDYVIPGASELLMHKRLS